MPSILSEKKSLKLQEKTHRFSPDIGGTATIRHRLLAVYKDGRHDAAGDYIEILLDISPLNVFEEEDRVVGEIALRQALLKTGVTNKAIRAKYIVYLYFWRDWTMAEIGEELDLSRERVSQILAETLAELRRILES